MYKPNYENIGKNIASMYGGIYLSHKVDGDEVVYNCEENGAAFVIVIMSDTLEEFDK